MSQVVIFQSIPTRQKQSFHRSNISGHLTNLSLLLQYLPHLLQNRPLILKVRSFVIMMRLSLQPRSTSQTQGKQMAGTKPYHRHRLHHSLPHLTGGPSQFLRVILCLSFSSHPLWKPFLAQGKRSALLNFVTVHSTPWR